MIQKAHFQFFASATSFWLRRDMWCQWSVRNPHMNVQSKFGYCMTIQTFNIALCKRDGITNRRTYNRTDDPNTRCLRRTFQAGGIKMKRVSPLIINNLHTEWLGKNCSLYRAHKFSQTESQSWHLTRWPKINRVPPLIIHSLHVKFESDWAKTVICICPQGFIHRVLKLTLTFDPVTEHQ